MGRKKIISMLVPLLLIAVIFISIAEILYYTDRVKEEEAYDQLVKELEEREQSIAEYEQSYSRLVSEMLKDAVATEKCGNTIKSVWGNAILKRHDDEADRYTMADGEFVEDFNDALSALFSDEEFSSNLAELSESQSSVRDRIKEISDPPEEYEEANKALEDMYRSYISFTDVVINCNGSFESFCEEFANADKEFCDSYNAVEAFMK